MTKARRNIDCPRDPIGLSLDETAVFIGMNPSLFLRLVHEGTLPAFRRLGSRQVWDADDFAKAFRRIP